MAVKVYVLLAMLVFAGVVMPIAHGLLGLNLGDLVSLKGVVPCSIGNSVNSSISSVFPNAGVQVRCGGNVVGSSTTNSNGEFSIAGLPAVILALLDCSVVVTTPLASCNVSLPSTGVLSAPVNIGKSLLGIITAIIGNFSFLQNIGS